MQHLADEEINVSPSISKGLHKGYEQIISYFYSGKTSLCQEVY